jgi:LysR family glycine cleavage system transcriptional activator
MTNNALVDFRQDRVDLCVRFGTGSYPDLTSKFLMHDHLYPVAHPNYLKVNKISTIADLDRATLIEDARPDMNWDLWFESTGTSANKPKPAIRYKGAHVVLEGALAGQGVAMVRHSLAWKFIEQGLIQKVDRYEVRSGYSYYLVAPTPYFKREKVTQFEQWITTEAKTFWNRSQEFMGEDRTIIHMP